MIKKLYEINCPLTAGGGGQGKNAIFFTCSLNVKAYKMDFLGDITSITVGNYETVYIQYIQMFLKRERS